jgi:high-affinity nickel-transport protein
MPLEREGVRIAILAAAIFAMYVAGIGLLLTFAPGHDGFVGTTTLAYTLGLRHAFDADHIAAIDNTTRKLRHSQQRRPVGVGFFFSLGHSTVVLALTIVGALVTHAAPNIGASTGFIGAGVSGLFLWIVGLLNLAVLLDIIKVALRIRAGTYDEGQLEYMLAPRGLLTRMGLDRLFRLVSRSWQMLPVGLLFGLGFETASEIALLALGAGAAVAGLPFTAVLCLPIMFAAGMSTMDTIDGVMMAHALTGLCAARPARSSTTSRSPRSR